MVTVLKTEGGTQLLSSNFQRIIQSLKEMTGNNSDTEVYNALKESNMDANEAAQKLLNQGPFHEVRRKRDKKKEVTLCQNTGDKGFSEHKMTEIANGSGKFQVADRNFDSSRRVGFTSELKMTEIANGSGRSQVSDRNFNSSRRDGFTRNEAVRPVSRNREFRVVRDNRLNKKPDKETKLVVDAGSGSVDHAPGANVSEKSAPGGSVNHKHSPRPYIPQTDKQMDDIQPKFAREVNSNGHRKEYTVGKKSAVPGATSHVQTDNGGHLQSKSVSSGASDSVGVYASASDPVHVPSPDSRSPAKKREVGVVGGRRQSSEAISKQPSQLSSSSAHSIHGTNSTLETFQPVNVAPKRDQPRNPSLSEPTVLNTSRVLSNQHHGSRQHQPLVGQQRGSLPGKEWKPKSSQKPQVSSPGVIGTPLKTASPSVYSEVQEADAAHLQDKLSQVSIVQAQNVIIAEHIRVPDNDRCRLMFGSFGVDVASSGESAESSGSEEISDVKPTNSPDEQVGTSGSSSPTDQATEQQNIDKDEAPAVSNAESYAETGMARGSSPSFSAPEFRYQESSELPKFSAYDPQTGYDIPYFRHVDAAAHGQNLTSPQEALTSHSTNNIPASSIAMLQQQQTMAQMYPQVHVSHFANVMPYRQILSPVYVPPMGLPGYSGNPTYTHPSNGSSFVLMPGGSSHLAPNNMKYGLQQFKPVPGGSASGFGNFGSPTGYPINPPGIIGGSTGHEDSARLKYKDNNLYVPNPQAETSEVWIQNPRDLSALQSPQYYNMQGQAGHPPYITHGAHPSFTPQSSHMQFPGVYHPTQATPLPNPHLAAPMGTNVGPVVGPGAQVGSYQQQQHGQQLNWTPNF